MDIMVGAVRLGNEMIEGGGRVGVEIVSREELIKRAPDAPNIYRLPPLDAYRIVTISGCDPIPCAGTHVGDIREIGRIVLNSIEKTDSQFKVYYDV